MPDARESMNMGSSRSANTIADLDRGLSGLIQKSSLLAQTWTGVNSVISSATTRIRGVFGGGNAGMGPSQVAPNPTFSAPPIQAMGYGMPGMQGSGFSVAAGPSATVVGGGFSGANLTQYVSQNPQAGTLYQPVAQASGGQVVSGGFGGGGGGGTGPTQGGLTPDDPGYSSGGTTESRFFGGRLSSVFGPGSLAGILNSYNLLGNFMPETSDVIESNLLLSRSAFFNKTPGQKLSDAYAQAQNQNKILAAQATLSGDNPALDVMRAMSAAQTYGLVSPNFNELLTGAARLSSIMPGIGMEGAVRATGAMQQARNVNLLRGIGIQLRDQNGNLVPPDKVIDQIWDKVCRDYKQAYGVGAPTLTEVRIALQPGNSLDSMLTMYFGNDPMLKQLVANGLIFRAQSSASISGQTPENLKSQLEQAGATTEAVSAFSSRNAAWSSLLSGLKVTGGMDSGVGMFKLVNEGIKNMIESFTSIIQSLTPTKVMFDTILSAAGGAPGDILSVLAGFTPRAEGGPVSGNRTYIVGEKGPEVFVPSTNGYIIPNDEIKRSGGATSNGGTYNNTYNLTVNVPNANTPEVIAAIKKLISDMERDKKVSES